MTPRTTCQRCQSALPTDLGAALACNLGCTYCRSCADGDLRGLCPACGGALEPRRPRLAAGGTAA